MEAERWKRVKEIFAEVFPLAGATRAEALSRACGEDAELRGEIESLLHQHDAAGRFLDAPLPAEEEQPPAIPGYRVVRLLARGGMGVVYLAEQEHPRRTVALKLIRTGMSAPDAVRRFQHEAQMLGLLQHPGIAQIFDAGSEGGRPYFVMEWVQGRTLAEYVEQEQLGIRERIELFVQICAAVQHAHQKGIIHRDLKPSNILVDENGQPKILDFGVARATDSDLQLTTLQTNVGQLIGTLPYMSPEQASGDPLALDTRSDVYALGVLLYEILAKRLPYDLEQKLLPQAVRVIAESAPMRLSSIDRVFRGDLETIVQKALEKEKERRYPSANELQNDLARYLRDEPIGARPPSAMYQLKRFARRNRALVAGVALAFLALVAGVIGTTREMLRAIRAEETSELRRRDAESQSTRAVQIQEFFRGMLTSANPESGFGGDVTVREVLERAAQRIGKRRKQNPEVDATIRQTIGMSYEALGLYDEAEPHLREALSLARSSLAPDHAVLADCLDSMSRIHHNKGELTQAEQLSREALAIRRNLTFNRSRRVSESLNNLALIVEQAGRHAEAESLFRETLELQRQLYGNEEHGVLITVNNLARLLVGRRRFDEAEEMLRQNLEVGSRALGADHGILGGTWNHLGELLHARGQLAEALEAAQQSIEIRRRALGNDHPFLAQSLAGAAEILLILGRPAEGEVLAREALAIEERTSGAASERHGRMIELISRQLGAQRKYEEAIPLAERALESQRKFGGPQHPDVGAVSNNLATYYQKVGRLDEAEALFREALEIYVAARGAEQPNVLAMKNGLATLYQQQGQLDEAEKLLQEVIEAMPRVMPEGQWQLGIAKGNYGKVLVGLQRYEDAEVALLESYELLKTHLGDKHKETTGAVARMVELYQRWQKAEKVEHYRKLLPLTR